MDTGQRNAKGRPILRGPRGGLYVVTSSGRKRPPATGRTQQKPKTSAARVPVWRKVATRAPSSARVPAWRKAMPRSPVTRLRNALARRVVANAARTHVGSKAQLGPRGMAGSQVPLARNANGTPAIDPVTLEPIPARQAIKVDKKWFDIRSIRALVGRGQPINPLTRQPFNRATLDKVLKIRRDDSKGYDGAIRYIANNMRAWLREWVTSPYAARSYKPEFQWFMSKKVSAGLKVSCRDGSPMKASVDVYLDEDPAVLVISLNCGRVLDFDVDYVENGRDGILSWKDEDTGTKQQVRITDVPDVMTQLGY